MNSIGLFLLRLTLGGIMIAHGVPKLMADRGGIEGFTKFLESKIALPELLAGVPFSVLAWAAVIAELAGGFFLILGVFQRFWGLVLAAVMLVAMLTVHLENDFYLVNAASPEEIAAWAGGPGKKFIPHGVEYTVALLAMALTLVFTGGGRIALFPGKKPVARDPSPVFQDHATEE